MMDHNIVDIVYKRLIKEANTDKISGRLKKLGIIRKFGVRSCTGLVETIFDNSEFCTKSSKSVVQLPDLRVLNTEEEVALIELISSQTKAIRENAKNFVANILIKEKENGKERQLPRSFKGPRPGNDWFLAFAKRNNLWRCILEIVLSPDDDLKLNSKSFVEINEMEKCLAMDCISPMNSNIRSKDQRSIHIEKFEPQIKLEVEDVKNYVADDENDDVYDPDNDSDFNEKEFENSDLEYIEPITDIESNHFPKSFSSRTLFESENVESGSDKGKKTTNSEKQFKCKRCNYQTNYRGNFRVHVLMHDEKNLYNCYRCSYRTDNKKMFRKHMKSTHANISQHKCNECEYETKYEGCLKKHMQSHGQFANCCSSCNFGTDDKNEMDLHLALHVEDSNLFRCLDCNYSTHNKRMLNRHILRHSKIKKQKSYQCSQCDFCAIKKSNLTMHLRTHSEPLKCELCSYSTYKKDALKRHSITHSNKRPYPCNNCQYSSKTKSELKRHELIHSETKQFLCYICGYATNKQATLRAHMLNHSGDKLYKCHLCTYGTNVQPNLKTHMIYHSNDKPFKCTECDYESKYRSVLNMHVLVHTKEKRFHCPQCEYGTNYRKDLNTHILNHTDQKMYLCDRCDYGTNQKTNLKVHYKHCSNRTEELN